MGGGVGITWPGDAIEIGCADAAVPAKSPAINIAKIERCIDLDSERWCAMPITDRNKHRLV